MIPAPPPIDPFLATGAAAAIAGALVLCVALLIDGIAAVFTGAKRKHRRRK